MNATCLLLTGLIAGADTPAKPVVVAQAAPVVVSTGAGCNGCTTVQAAPVMAATQCSPCGSPATLVDWMKAKAAEPSKPGLIARLRARHAKPATTTVASSPCDPCATGTLAQPGTVIATPAPAVATPGAGGGVPAEMPKQKDMPKVDPPKDLPKTATPPKTGTEVPKPADAPKTGSEPPKTGAIDLPRLPAVPTAPGAVLVPSLPVVPTSGTNSPY